jgi:predicted Rossmann fold flavoprotein
MPASDVIIVGGGPAAFMAAIECAGHSPGAQIVVLEKGPRFLEKVRISGGGRCNVTHACFDPREFATRYPRGGKALLTPFQAFSAQDTVDWFEARGVRLKTEPDGRMFPDSNSSETIVDCLLDSARAAGVSLRLHADVTSVAIGADGGFLVGLANGDALQARNLLLATGGCRGNAALELSASLGHTLEPPVPSLFTFRIEVPWLRALAGVSLPDCGIAIPSAGLQERGPLLLTHWGLSGPAVLKASAWGARALHAAQYRFAIQVRWIPGASPEHLASELTSRRQSQGARRVTGLPIAPIPSRLWEQLVLSVGIPQDTRWSSLTRSQTHALVLVLTRSEFQVTGKSTNKDEFVTCGGVRLREVDFRSMASRVCPGLFLAGELLDVDGLTGGFNLQAAWSTGYVAGRSLGERIRNAH